jgi:hypothetical protein
LRRVLEATFDDETTLSREPPAPKRDAAAPPATDDPMALALWSGFAEATAQAVSAAHAEGLAVPARHHGVDVEVRPDGTVVPVDLRSWQPTAWKRSARR